MVETIIYCQQNYTLQECTGLVTNKELLDTAQSFFGGSHTRYVIWDFSVAQMINISPETIQKLVAIWLKQKARRRGGKTAVVAPADLEYSFSNILDTISELNEAPFETRVFRSLEDAKQWLF